MHWPLWLPRWNAACPLLSTLLFQPPPLLSTLLFQPAPLLSTVLLPGLHPATLAANTTSNRMIPLHDAVVGALYSPPHALCVTTKTRHLSRPAFEHESSAESQQESNTDSHSMLCVQVVACIAYDAAAGALCVLIKSFCCKRACSVCRWWRAWRMTPRPGRSTLA